MTVRTRAQIQAAINSDIQDNDVQDITPAEVRSILTDILDSFALLSEIGTDPDLTHTRYGLLTATAAIPTEFQFIASSITSTDTELTVPAYATAMYLHFADIHSALTTIQQTNSQFNGRLGFSSSPTALTISGVAHYVYSSVAARSPVGERTWRLEP